MAKHLITIPDEFEVIISAEAAKAKLTVDEYLQSEVDKKITQILNAFITDNSGLSENEINEMHKSFALIKSNILTARKKQ